MFNNIQNLRKRRLDMDKLPDCTPWCQSESYEEDAAKLILLLVANGLRCIITVDHSKYLVRTGSIRMCLIARLPWSLSDSYDLHTATRNIFWWILQELWEFKRKSHFFRYLVDRCILNVLYFFHLQMLKFMFLTFNGWYYVYKKICAKFSSSS